MAEFLEQDLEYSTPLRSGGASPVDLSGQRYREPGMNETQITYGTRPWHPQARGCFTMGETVDGNFVVTGERPPTQ